MKLPAFQFYPADWRKDSGVQALNRHDRSVWFDMLCIMHESEERGVLMLAGRPMPEEALASILNLDKQILTTTLTTLLTYGVARRREEDGAIFSKRMVEDEKLIQTRRNAGKQGGNPLLLNQNAKQKPTTPVKQKPTPSSSSSSSSSSSDNKDSVSADAPPPALESEKPKGSSQQPPKKADDEEWLTEIATNPAYTGINVRHELGKMQAWCSVNRKQPSRQRFINWLNRAERPIAALSKNQAYDAKSATAGKTREQVLDF